MKDLTHITLDPAVMGGNPCIRGSRVTAGFDSAAIVADRATIFR